jgi:hypothetical protein
MAGPPHAGTVDLMPHEPRHPHTVEALLRVVEARDSGAGLLKLMVDKLKLQLLRRNRMRVRQLQRATGTTRKAR